MKIAIISANVGGIDKFHLHAIQNTECICYSFTENNLPVPLHGVSNRMKAKYIKAQAHKFIEADIFIWIDGSCQIISSGFVDFMINTLGSANVAIPLHPKRSNAYEEMSFIIDCLNSGDKYTTDRYSGMDFSKELQLYMKSYLPVNYPLFACSVFARVNSLKVNKFFDEWWMRSVEYFDFDQGLFSLEAFKNDIVINSFPFSETEKYITKHKHETD